MGPDELLANFRFGCCLIAAAMHSTTRTRAPHELTSDAMKLAKLWAAEMGPFYQEDRT